MRKKYGTRGKYNMTVSMSERMSGVGKKLTLNGCLNKWALKEHKKMEKANVIR